MHIEVINTWHVLYGHSHNRSSSKSPLLIFIIILLSFVKLNGTLLLVLGYQTPR